MPAVYLEIRRSGPDCDEAGCSRSRHRRSKRISLDVLLNSLSRGLEHLESLQKGKSYLPRRAVALFGDYEFGLTAQVGCIPFVHLRAVNEQHCISVFFDRSGLL